RGLLDDLGHQVETVLGGRGDGLEGVAAVGLGDGVGAQALHRVEGVGHGGDAGGVRRLELVHQLEHVAKARQGGGDVLFADLDAGEFRQLFNVRSLDCHGMIPVFLTGPVGAGVALQGRGVTVAYLRLALNPSGCYSRPHLAVSSSPRSAPSRCGGYLFIRENQVVCLNGCVACSPMTCPLIWEPPILSSMCATRASSSTSPRWWRSAIARGRRSSRRWVSRPSACWAVPPATSPPSGP